jgi:hypothetical protein
MGPGRGVSGTRRGLRHEGAVQEGERGEGNKEEGERCWKSGGDECVFIPGERLGWQRSSGPTPIPDAAGGEGGHGAAKLDGVIHRCIPLTRSFPKVRGEIHDCADNFGLRQQQSCTFQLCAPSSVHRPRTGSNLAIC